MDYAEKSGNRDMIELLKASGLAFGCGLNEDEGLQQ
jgi:hypothetical protein